MSDSKSKRPNLKAVPEGDAKRVDGEKLAAELLAGLDPAHRERLLKSVAARDPALGERLKGKMFGFKELARLDDKSFATLVRSLPPALVALAMRKAPEEIEVKLKASLTARALAALEEEKQSMGPRKLSEVTAAQQKIADVALEMLTRGELSFDA